MADPLSKTFEWLTATKNHVAVDVLVSALDSRHAVICDRAATALLQRGTIRCQTEVIRRLATLSPESRRLLDSQGMRLSATLRQCILHGDIELRSNGLTIVVTTEGYDQIATVLQILEHAGDPLQETACHSLQDLVNRLYEHCHLPGRNKSADRFQRNFGQVRQTVLGALDGACNRFDSLAHAAEVVECILVLGDAANVTVRKVLSQQTPACRDTAANLLMTSKHPGVMRLAMDFMNQNYPHAKVIAAFQRRTDAEFVSYALRNFPKRLSENQQKNFKQLTELDWTAQDGLPLEAIPPGLHESLVHFIQATGLNAERKAEIQKWLLQNGSVEGRLAAGRVLDTLAPDAVHGILCGSLESEDPGVQAWATSQLRAQGIPEAISLLIERLDSPIPAVREAARGELESFNLDLVLNIFDHLDHELAMRAGALVRKIDPSCVEKLLQELNSSIRRRRIRGARAAAAIGLARDVQAGLLGMLSDDDALVRRTAAEVLGAIPNAEVVAGLAELLRDPSVRVREAAELSLDQIQRAGMDPAEFRSIARETETAGG